LKIKLTAKQRIQAAFSGTIDDFRRAFLSGDDISNGEINQDMAMKYSAVAACVRVRAETFASVPAVLYQKNEDGRDPRTDLDIYDILHYRPNEEMAPFGFKEAMMTNFDTGGNVVCERLMNQAGNLVGLYPYDSSIVSIKRNDAGRLIYEVRGKNEVKTLRRDQVFHVPNLSFDGVIGMSPVAYAASAIRLGLSYEQYGVNFYQNSAMPSGVFEHPEALKDDAFERLKKGLKENYTGLKNSGVPMLLEGGMKWNQVTVNPIDAQLLESKYFQTEDICRIYRVPPHLVQDLRKSTNNNIEHQSLEFVMYTMLPIFKRYEDNINMQLMTREQRKKGYYIEFKIDGLLRGDAKSRAEAYAVGREWGWLSVNDIRKLENMPPVENGNIYLQPMNYIEAGKPQEQADAMNRLVEDIYNIITERRVA